MSPPRASSAGPGGGEVATPGSDGRVAEALLAGAGLVGFAATAHGGPGLRLVALAGLILTASCMARALVAAEPASSALGVLRWQGRSGAAWSVAGLTAGSALALWYRAYLQGPFLPLVLRPFAGMALLIGATEELVYRGYIQGRLRPLGPVAATLLAAGLHALYKGALFAGPPTPAPAVDIGVLAGFTFAVGALLGALRERSGTLWPCLLAHMAFDLLVYGDAASAPWWVWR